MYSWDLDELKEKKIKNEFAISEAKRKQFEKTKLQKIRISARENSTLVDVLLNGSLVKWLFLLFMLFGTITLFIANEDNHWIEISIVDGQEKYTFNEDAYEIDYTTYSNIGERMISNFDTLQETTAVGQQIFLTLNDIRLWVTNFIKEQPRIIPPITGPVLPIFPWLR
jgi:hypothetical protein